MKILWRILKVIIGLFAILLGISVFLLGIGGLSSPMVASSSSQENEVFLILFFGLVASFFIIGGMRLLRYRMENKEVADKWDDASEDS
jgi:hypothetical protein